MSALVRGEPVEEFPGATGWNCDDDADMDNANRLTLITLSIPSIRSTANSILKKEKTSSSTMELMKCVQLAQEVDAQLEEWVGSLPDTWFPTIKKVVTEEPKDFYRSFFYPGPVYTYEDMSIAGVMMDYTMARMICQTITMQCIDGLPTNSQSDKLRQTNTRAVYISRNMVNEIASTLPYLFGFNMEYSSGSKSESHARGKRTIAPYFMTHTKLNTAQKSAGAFIASPPCMWALSVKVIPETQRQFFIGRLLYIWNEFKLGLDGEKTVGGETN
jgi:hypothetical protein